MFNYFKFINKCRINVATSTIFSLMKHQSQITRNKQLQNQPLCKNVIFHTEHYLNA